MRVAVVGLGSAGARHARNLLALGHEVMGFDPASTPTPPGVRRADSFDSALAEAEAVVVASPSSLHAEQAVAALEAGRHVLVEKPLAMTVAEAERVVEAARGTSARLRRRDEPAFSPRHPRARAAARRPGRSGTIRLAQASFGYDLRLWRPDADYRHGYSARADLGGGIVLDAIHELDYLLSLLGPVATVTAETAQLSDLEIDVEDVAVAILRFESGALGVADLNFFEPAYRRGCLLVGSDAVARWEWAQGSVTLARNEQPTQAVDVGTDLAQTYKAELDDFLAAVQGDARPRVPAEEGLAAVRVADAIRRSSEAGQRISLS